MTDREKTGRERLCEAFKKANELWLEEYPPCAEKSVYSPEYNAKIRKLMRKSRTPYSRLSHTFGRRAAAFIMAAVIGAAAFITGCAVYKPVAKFITVAYDGFINIFFEKDDIDSAPESIETQYAPEYLPDGFTLADKKENTFSVTRVYSRGEEEITVGQYIFAYDSTADNETESYRTLYSKGSEIKVTERYGEKTLFWDNGEYLFDMIVPSGISDRECIKIIESMGGTT